jgi:diguanylate cyclase (GGDEF)-like protein
LETLASTDHLTGLPNRREFQERLGGEITRARRHERQLSLLVLDLDHFKSVNDSHGHPVGDRVLIETARRLAGLVRQGEVVARIGGEEFAVILPETDGQSAVAAAQRMRMAIQARPFPGVGPLTVSGGVCSLSDARDGDDLFRLADVALYAAKARGRNRVVLYSPDALGIGPGAS